MIPEAAVEAAARAMYAGDWDALHSPAKNVRLSIFRKALEAAAPHMAAKGEDKLAAIIVLLDPFERVTGWMATDKEAGHYAVEAIRKIRAILDAT